MTTESYTYKATSSAMVLLAIAALLGAVVLYQVAEFSMGAANAALAVARATGAGTTEPNEVETRLAQARSVAEALKKNNLFVPPPPKQNPVSAVLGILGNEALINGKWYKAGDSVRDAKIIAVEPTKIRVSWNGQEKEFAPLGAEGSGPGGGPRPPARMPAPGSARKLGRDPGRQRPERPARISSEEQIALRDRFRNASPEERAKLRGQMRERPAARGR